MLFLLLQLGEHRYALEASQVAAVLPLVAVMPIPQAPPALAGIFNYHGAPVPVIDLSQTLLGRPALRRLHTRIVLVHYFDDSGASHPLGLIAERATETLHRDPADFTASGVSLPHLGPVATDARGLVQRIELHQLLPAPVRDLLFRQPLPL
jgi:chemotaxis-related protein WspB